jgi:hypothetical protein
MKIKLSKSQWEQMGKTAGWLKKSQFSENMMPGQTPYNSEEKKKLNGLISDAAQGDPGEQDEASDPYKTKRTIRITFNDGEELETWINGTRKEIVKYYMPYGNRGPDQDFDNTHPEKVHHVVKVDFLD